MSLGIDAGWLLQLLMRMRKALNVSIEVSSICEEDVICEKPDGMRQETQSCYIAQARQSEGYLRTCNKPTHKQIILARFTPTPTFAFPGSLSTSSC
jgi:hypothetical protein